MCTNLYDNNLLNNLYKNVISIHIAPFMFVFFALNVFSMFGISATRFENRQWIDLKKAKIMNGDKAYNISQFPFQVLIQATSCDDRIFCGGVILNASYVLTAAHCYLGNDYDYQVYAGSITPLNEPEEESFKIFDVKRFIVHHHFDPLFMINDISLIQISGHFWQDKPSDLIGSLSLATCGARGGCTGDVELVVAGWGYTEKNYLINPDFPPELYYSTLIRGSNRNCMLKLERSIKHKFCAFGESTGPCNSDSGGAAVSSGKIIGIASMGDNTSCMFTDVLYYRHWILHNHQSNQTISLRVLFTNFVIVICVYKYYTF